MACKLVFSWFIGYEDLYSLYHLERKAVLAFEIYCGYHEIKQKGVNQVEHSETQWKKGGLWTCGQSRLPGIKHRMNPRSCPSTAVSP